MTWDDLTHNFKELVDLVFGGLATAVDCVKYGSADHAAAALASLQAVWKFMLTRGCLLHLDNYTEHGSEASAALLFACCVTLIGKFV